VPYESWFAEQQRIMKQGGKILKVELATGRPQVNVGN
jgi:phycobilisome core linker protein